MSIPIKIKKLPLETKAYIVRRRVIATVAPMAKGITGPSVDSTTAEQAQLIMYEKHSTKKSSIILSRGGSLAFGMQIAKKTITAIITIGMNMIHQFSSWKLRNP